MSAARVAGSRLSPLPCLLHPRQGWGMGALHGIVGAAAAPVGRRRLLHAAGAVAALIGLGVAGRSSPPAAAEQATPRRVLGQEDRYIALANFATREYALAWHVRGGAPVPEEAARLDWILRDWREGEAVRMDRRLYDLLFVVQQHFRSPYPLVVNSGYRTPRTNAVLAEHFPGVARNSFHMQGMAVDFHIPGVPPRAAFALLARLGVGGVGLYDGFTHVDVGPPRWWSGERNAMGAWTGEGATRR
jgi:uncharacterized protein YcbK (DUF882 family)